MLQGGLCSTTVLHAAALRLTTCESLELSESSCAQRIVDRSRALARWLKNWLPQACSSAMSSWKPRLPASGNEAVMPQAHVGLFRTSCGHLTFFQCSLCCL